MSVWDPGRKQIIPEWQQMAGRRPTGPGQAGAGGIHGGAEPRTLKLWDQQQRAGSQGFHPAASFGSFQGESDSLVKYKLLDY